MINNSLACSKRPNDQGRGITYASRGCGAVWSTSVTDANSFERDSKHSSAGREKHSTTHGHFYPSWNALRTSHSLIC